MVGAHAHIAAGIKLGAALAEDDRAGVYQLSAVGLNPQSLGIAVSAVAG